MSNIKYMVFPMHRSFISSQRFAHMSSMVAELALPSESTRGKNDTAQYDHDLSLRVNRVIRNGVDPIINFWLLMPVMGPLSFLWEGDLGFQVRLVGWPLGQFFLGLSKSPNVSFSKYFGNTLLVLSSF